MSWWTEFFKSGLEEDAGIKMAQAKTTPKRAAPWTLLPPTAELLEIKLLDGGEHVCLYTFGHEPGDVATLYLRTQVYQREELISDSCAKLNGRLIAKTLAEWFPPSPTEKKVTP